LVGNVDAHAVHCPPRPTEKMWRFESGTTG
jgi:hypothetical protein